MVIAGSVKSLEDNGRNGVTLGLKVQQTGTAQIWLVTVNKDTAKQFPLGARVSINIEVKPGEET